LTKSETSSPRASLSLGANFAWLFLGTMVYGAAQWVYLVLVARWGSPAEVGIYALALAICSPVFLFFEGKLREVQATDVLGTLHFSDYVVVRAWSAGIAFTVATTFVLVAPFTGASALIVVAVGFGKTVDSLGDILYGRMQLSERMDLIAKSRIWKGIAGIVAATLVLRATSSLFWMLIGIGVAWATVLVLVDLRFLAALHGSGSSLTLLKWLRGNASLKRSRRLLKDVLPLGTVSALVSLRENLPRYILLRTHGIAAVGLFTAAMTMPEAGKRIVDPLGQALLPQLAARLHRDRKGFLRLLGRAVAIVILLALVGLAISVVAGDELLELLYGPEYAAYSAVLVVGVFAAGLNFVASILNIGVLATRWFLVQLPAAVIAAAAVLVAGVIWIPQYGAVGGAFALGLGMATWAATLGAALWLALRRAGPGTVDASAEHAAEAPAALTVSLEVELAWGCRHHLHSPDGISRFSAGRRTESRRVEQLVSLCDELELPIVFDVVGHLFLEECDGCHDSWVGGGPVPGDPGTSRTADPLFYARDLVDRIASAKTPHEICTHTFFHLNGAELTAEALRQDLEAAKRVHREAGLPVPTSIVPPRHQDLPRGVLTDLGFTAMRVPFPVYESAYGARPGLIRRFMDYFVRPHPVAPARHMNGLIETYCTPFTSLTAPYLPVGQLREHWAFRLLPLRLRQRYHLRYLRRALRDAIDSRSQLHVWTHLFDLAHPAQWENAAAFLREVARERNAGRIEVLRMEDLHRVTPAPASALQLQAS
jgi:O-antigen/teichoic acid export membrane protein/peptidoglycan/xylan/chitin deacetylase (PgdA/CDA1 family)